MKSAVVGYPRVGDLRQLKFATEKYFKGKIDKDALLDTAQNIKKEQFKKQKSAGITYIPSNDFSFYDGILDTIVMLNAAPKRYTDLDLEPLDTYFAMARGYQGEKGDVKALAMKKWFNTNYHYMVPELDDDTQIKLANYDFISEYRDAKEAGVNTKPVIIGGFTFLKLSQYLGSKKIDDYVDDVITAYSDILKKCDEENIPWVQFDEPVLVTDLSEEDTRIYKRIYENVLKNKGGVKVLLQTYFGDIRDCYGQTISLDLDGVGLDFVEGKKTSKLLKDNGFPKGKVLFAGVVNGKNIWKSNYRKKLEIINEIKEHADNIIIGTSCSLLHVPYTLEHEKELDEAVKKHLAFAEEKLGELSDLCALAECNDPTKETAYIKNQEAFAQKIEHGNKKVQEAVVSLTDDDFNRKTPRLERAKMQQKVFDFPLLPTTTIGSFPQTLEVKANRRKYKKGEITKEEYDRNVREFIKECISLQEDLDIDVLVHGEYERNDMVEFFGENLDGFIFTQKAWVQSYGTRCVKPPIIFGDISRQSPITVSYIKYANSLTDRPVKGMLTGPVTILNWSFPREDISLKEMAYQIALAIREEVLDLQAEGINIIQIDEAALKEKLPIRKKDWHEGYLDWAIKAFRLCHSDVADGTQIHTHMCYSEFDEIIKEIDDMDADVISFEASRSKLGILDSLQENDFQTQVGPGVYDIHSPRVPSVDEIEQVIKKMLAKIPQEKLWVNPDCGLKTRGTEETVKSLQNMVLATKRVREIL